MILRPNKTLLVLIPLGLLLWDSIIREGGFVFVDAADCATVCPQIDCPSVAEQQKLQGNGQAGCAATQSSLQHSECHNPHGSCLDFDASPPPNNDDESEGGTWFRFPYESSTYKSITITDWKSVIYECWGSCACNIFGSDCTPCGFCSGCQGNCGATYCNPPSEGGCEDQRIRRQLELEDDEKNDDEEVVKDYKAYMALSDAEKQDRLERLYCKIDYVARDPQRFVDAIEDLVDTNHDGVLSLEEFKLAYYDMEPLIKEHCVSAKDRIQELEDTCSSSSSKKTKKAKKK